jgi:AcrR family transcriptional regulator
MRSRASSDSASPPRPPGRPRSEKARKAVIASTLELLKRSGFNDLQMEAVAARAGVGKATIYRWWPSKVELVIDAFAFAVDEELRFPPHGSMEKAIRKQMRRWVQVFRSPLGQIIANVVGAGQSDPAILEAFRAHWVAPRRKEARRLIRQAMKNGEFRPDLDPDTVLDILYGPLYLRLLLKNSPLTGKFTDLICDLIFPSLCPARSPLISS